MAAKSRELACVRRERVQRPCCNRSTNPRFDTPRPDFHGAPSFNSLDVRSRNDRRRRPPRACGAGREPAIMAPDPASPPSETAMTAELKQLVAERIDALAETNCSHVSHDIHAHPELAFNEHHASGLLCDALAAAGLPVEAFGVRSRDRIRKRVRGDRGRSARSVARRIRRATRHRPCVRTQSDRHLRARRSARPGCNSRSAVRHGAAVGNPGRRERRRQGTDGARRRIRRCRCGDDDPSVGHQPDDDAVHLCRRGARRISRPRSARVRDAAPRHQRARRIAARLSGHLESAPAHTGDRTHSRHHHRRRHGTEHRAGLSRRAISTYAPRTSKIWRG